MTLKASNYPLIVEPLSDEDGNGFVAIAPDLPGCMSDGETPEEAVINVRDAILCWVEAAQEQGHARSHQDTWCWRANPLALIYFKSPTYLSAGLTTG